MPGDISRDFAASLSKLHYEVTELKKQNKKLEQQVEELTETVKEGSRKDERKQRGRVLRAAASQDAAEIDSLLPQTADITEAELLRAFRPVEPLTQIDININPNLLENFRQSTQGSMPELIQQDEPEVVPYILSDQYKAQSMAAAQRDAALKQMAAQQARAMEEQRKQKEENNMLRKLSPLWKTSIDDV